MTKQLTRISRSSPAATGNLVSVGTPAFISLVGKPANQRPFKVIRDDKTTADTTPRAVRTARRGTPATMKAARRSEDGILALTFPSGCTKEDAESSLLTFGLTGYTITETAGIFTASRGEPDLQLIAKSASIKLTSDGIMAVMDENVYTEPVLTPKPSVSLVRFEFDASKYDADKVSAWLKKNSVDNTQDDTQNSGDAIISVKRKDVAEGVEVRRMELEVGVVAVVVQSEALDVPDDFAVGVVECCYGQWGWGQLDFSASMADRAFCDQLDTAESRIRSVLNSILFYSELPLELRKTLVSTALTQYGDFINNAIDALPRQVLLLATRSDSDTSQEIQMTTEAQKKADEAAAVKRADEDAAAKLAATNAAQAEIDAKPVTRGELTSLVTDAVTAAMAATGTVATPVVRSDVATPATPAAVSATEAVSISRADLLSVMAEAIKPLGDRLEKIESTSTVRSDQGDPPVVVAGKDAAPKSIFRGAIFGGNKE